MRDPINLSIPLGRLFGVNIRVHILFPIVVLGLILRVAYRKIPGSEEYAFPPGAWIDETILLTLLFGSVFLHEFGHCFGARAVNGDASDILMWPLGGLASVDVPHTARANFITTAAGPAVNLVLCLVSGLLLYFLYDAQPPWNPLTPLFRNHEGQFRVTNLAGELVKTSPYSGPALLVRLFLVNWMLFLFNVVLIGFPLDGGRLFQSILWKYVGYRQATLAAVFAGFVTMFVIGLYGIVADEMMALCLAVFIYFACKNQWLILETGGEESVFGYDFSQGYTSLERDEPAPGPTTRKLSWWQKWRQGRAASKMKREMENREHDERRMDQLLEKISSQGISSLTDEEKRFMKHFSDRYKNRHS